MTNDPVIFNRQCVKQHRDRATKNFSNHDFLFREMAARLGDRLLDITRTFPIALDLGAHNGLLADYIPLQAGIKTLVQSDMSQAMITGAEGLRVTCDEESLPFAENTFDLAMSVGSLHWVNDVPGTLIQIHHSLKPSGGLIAMIAGGETLKELRLSLEQAELALTGGISPRVSPFIDVKDAGSLLQRAGFEMPVTDSERLTVWYDDPLKLLADLRGMGEASALLAAAPHFTRRSVLFAALEYYREHFANAQGKIPASFDIVTLTAWKADAA